MANIEAANKNETSIPLIDIITSQLYNWVNAWQNKKVQSYLSFYSNNFKDNKRSRSKWEAYKRRSLRSRSDILIKISDLEVTLLKEGLVKTTFIQRFKSNRISDIGQKELYWQKERNGWKIIKEIWRPL